MAHDDAAPARDPRELKRDAVADDDVERFYRVARQLPPDVKLSPHGMATDGACIRRGLEDFLSRRAAGTMGDGEDAPWHPEFIRALVGDYPDGPHAKAFEEFRLWFAANYPGPHTVISDPHWHAGKIFRNAVGCIERSFAARQSSPSQPAG